MKKARRNRNTAGSLTGSWSEPAADAKLQMRRARRRVGKEIIKEELQGDCDAKAIEG
jgi:hypothetical protein